MRRPHGLHSFCAKRTWLPGPASKQTREIGLRLPGSRQSHANASANGCRRRQRGRRPRCQWPLRPKAAAPLRALADARDLERAARYHRMKSRCAAGAEGASLERLGLLRAHFHFPLASTLTLMLHSALAIPRSADSARAPSHVYRFLRQLTSGSCICDLPPLRHLRVPAKLEWLQNLNARSTNRIFCLPGPEQSHLRLGC
jgi:hypothetical protein